MDSRDQELNRKRKINDYNHKIDYSQGFDQQYTNLHETGFAPSEQWAAENYSFIAGMLGLDSSPTLRPSTEFSLSYSEALTFFESIEPIEKSPSIDLKNNNNTNSETQNISHSNRTVSQQAEFLLPQENNGNTDEIVLHYQQYDFLNTKIENLKTTRDKAIFKTTYDDIKGADLHNVLMHRLKGRIVKSSSKHKQGTGTELLLILNAALEASVELEIVNELCRDNPFLSTIQSYGGYKQELIINLFIQELREGKDHQLIKNSLFLIKKGGFRKLNRRLFKAFMDRKNTANSAEAKKILKNFIELIEHINNTYPAAKLDERDMVKLRKYTDNTRPLSRFETSEMMQASQVFPPCNMPSEMYPYPGESVLPDDLVSSQLYAYPPQIPYNNNDNNNQSGIQAWTVQRDFANPVALSMDNTPTNQLPQMNYYQQTVTDFSDRVGEATSDLDNNNQPDTEFEDLFNAIQSYPYQYGLVKDNDKEIKVYIVGYSIIELIKKAIKLLKNTSRDNFQKFYTLPIIKDLLDGANYIIAGKKVNHFIIYWDRLTIVNNAVKIKVDFQILNYLLFESKNFMNIILDKNLNKTNFLEYIVQKGLDGESIENLKKLVDILTPGLQKRLLTKLNEAVYNYPKDKFPAKNLQDYVERIILVLKRNAQPISVVPNSVFKPNQRLNVNDIWNLMTNNNKPQDTSGHVL